MGDSVQDIYAKNLPTEFGYPLRIPEPSSNLPESYQERGLQIGDVGYVDGYGRFQVLFNIRYSSNHELHRKHHVPVDFQPIECDEEVEVDVTSNAIPLERCISSTHIRREQPPPSDERVLYRFLSSEPSQSGAILILPSGATCHELREKEEFRRIAVKNAQSWCAFARRNSLYLITGLHKARSWSLGSFSSALHDGEILVKRPNGKDANTQIHMWEPSFSVDWRAGPGSTRDDNPNQTVFITGFKVTVRWWFPAPVVELLPRPFSGWFAFFHVCVSILLGLWDILWQRIALQNHEHVPRLSQPFHPSDVINRYLLAKNPTAQVAVTHDSQWMSALTMEELIHDGIVNEDYIWEVLSDRYVSASDSGAVWLESKSGDANKGFKVAHSLSFPSNNGAFVAISGDANDPRTELKAFSLRMPPTDNPWIVISRIRADNIITSFGRLPVGFFVLLQYNDLRRRTKVRSIPVCENIVEWDDEIILRYDFSTKVQLSFCAVFEFEPTLGNGSALCMADITIGNLAGSTSLINFAVGKTACCSSLLINAERRYCPHLGAYSSYENTDSGREKSSAMVHETDAGHNALLRYYEYYREEDLKEATQHFECALRICHADHEYRPAALVNLAMVKFHRFEASAIALYQEALEMRPAPHPDRPATLVSLGQALLYHYRRRGQDESLMVDLKKLMNEVKQTCPEGSRWRRAAVLVLQTHKLIEAENYCALSEIDELILELDAAVRLPPDNYFDRPYRLGNLGLALGRRFEIQGDHGRLADLDQAISIQEDALQLVHERCPDHVSHLSNLGWSLCTRFKKLGDIHDLERAVAMQERVVSLTPEYHPDRAKHLHNLGQSLIIRFKKSGDIKDIDRAVVMAEAAVELTPDDFPDLQVAQRLQNLGVSLGARFKKLGKIADLSRAILRLEEAVRLTPQDHPHRAGCLQNLGECLSTCFGELGDIGYLDQAIARLEEAVQLTPEDRSDRASYLADLGLFRWSRFQKFGDIRDLEQAIVRSEEAVRLVPEERADCATYLSNLGRFLCTRFSRLGDIHDLEEAISRQEVTIRLTPEDHSDRASRLSTLAISLRNRFIKLENIADLGQATAMLEEAVRLTPQDPPRPVESLQNIGVSLSPLDELGDIRGFEEVIAGSVGAAQLTLEDCPDRAFYLTNLGWCLCIRFQQLGDIKDLERAIVFGEEAVQITPEDHSDLASHVSILAISLCTRFYELGNIRDLEQAIPLAEQAVRLTPEVYPHRALHLLNLGVALKARFDKLRDIKDIERAIALVEVAIQLTPDHPRGALPPQSFWVPCFNEFGHMCDLKEGIVRSEEVAPLALEGHIARAAHLGRLGVYLRTHFYMLGDIRDLERAISLEERALQIIPVEHSEHAVRLSNLGNSLCARFYTLGDIRDLERAISLGEHAIQLTPGDHPHHIHHLLNIGVSLKVRFDRLGDIKDLQRSVAVLEEAVKLTPEGHGNRASCLGYLGGSLFTRFYEFGDIRDIERAIALTEEAIWFTPRNHPHRVQYLENLRVVLQAHFDELGDTRRSEQAIARQDVSAQLTPEDQSDRASRLGRLGGSHFAYFCELGDVKDLERAIALAVEAIQLTTEDHPLRSQFLQNLGSFLKARFDRIRDIKDLEQAIATLEEAVNLTPEGHTDRTYCLTYLGQYLLTRFYELGDIKDIERVIGLVEDVMQLTPENHPFYVQSLQNLGVSLKARFDKLKDIKDLDRAIAMLEEAVNLELTSEGYAYHAERLRILNGLIYDAKYLRSYSMYNLPIGVLGDDYLADVP